MEEGARPLSDPFDARAAHAGLEAALRDLYAYLDRPDLDVDGLLARVRDEAARCSDRRALRRVWLEGLVAFADPHLALLPRDDDDPNTWPTAADLAVDGAGLVLDVRAGSAADAAGLRPGATVEAVDGVGVAAASTALLRLVADPRPDQRAWAATLAVNGRRGQAERRLALRGAGDVTLPSPRRHAEAVAARPPVTVERRGRLGRLRLENSLGRLETIAAFDAALAGCLDLDALVLDLRDTPSGGTTDVARAIIGHFVAEPRPYQVHEVPATLRRTGVPRRFIEYALPRPPRFRGRLAVLGGRWTGSMGEGLLIGLHAAAGARTFASRLGRLLGALHGVDLPSGLRLELGAEALLHVDGTPREAFVADVPLASADRDPDGQDPALRAAEAWLAG